MKVKFKVKVKGSGLETDPFRADLPVDIQDYEAIYINDKKNIAYIRVEDKHSNELIKSGAKILTDADIESELIDA